MSAEPPRLLGTYKTPVFGYGGTAFCEVRGECEIVKRRHLRWQPQVRQVDLDPPRLRAGAGQVRRPAIGHLTIHDPWMLIHPQRS